MQSHSAARLNFNSTSVGFSPASVQPFFDADFYGAYPGANLSGDPFLSLVNGTSGVGLPVALAGLVANVSNGQVALLTSPTALEKCLASRCYEVVCDGEIAVLRFGCRGWKLVWAGLR